MRRVTLSLALLLALAFCFSGPVTVCAAPPEEASQPLITIHQNGKRLHLSARELGLKAVQNSALHYAALSAQEAQALGLQAGLYIVDAKGKLSAFTPTEDATICSAVLLAPSSRILAMDVGTYVTRAWVFYSYPEMKVLGSTGYLSDSDQPELLWYNQDRALVTQVRDNSNRRCDYDPCGPTSVIMYDPARNHEQMLFYGSDLCDYRLDSLQDGQLSVNKICHTRLQDWRDQQTDPKVMKITIQLPE